MGLEVDHGYSIHHCDSFMYWQMYVCDMYVCIAHPGPKASEQEEQLKKVTYTPVSLMPVKILENNFAERTLPK